MRIWLLLSLLALTACGDRQPAIPRVPVHDLIANLDLAKVQREPGLVDLGTPQARAVLGRGWSHDETSGERTYVWSDGPESEIEFFLAVPRDVPLSLRGEAYRAASAPLQEVVLDLNGETVGRLPVPAEPGGELKGLVLPERHLRQGMNRLVLRYAWTRSPAEDSGGSSEDRRRLAVAWDFLRFGTGMDEQGRVRAAGDQLAMPFGWRIDSFLRLPAGAALVLDGLRSRGDKPGELLVTVQSEDGEEREVARLGPKDRPTTVELENEEDGLLRLSLTAIPREPGGPAGSGLVLRRPVLVASAAATRPASSPSTPAVPSGPLRNVIVYLVDTLRADHLGCYGYPKPVSPRIDAFARRATIFRHTVAQSSWTRPSTATILTGLMPITHGVQTRRSSLSEKAVTLAEMLKARGYRTAGFITNGNVARSFGFGQGFETYKILPHNRNSAAEVNARAAEWLDGLGKGEAPFFLYLHTVEPHAPYGPPPAFRQRFAPGAQNEETHMRILRLLQRGKVQPTPELLRNLLDLYDAEIATNDAAFGDLMDLLVRRGLWEETVVVFVSDHGEEFLDHGDWEHGKTLHTEMLDVPLILRIPGVGEGKVVERLAQHADIVPTLLVALGLPVPEAVEGRSLVSWMAGGGPPEEAGAEEAAFSWLDRDANRSAAVTTPDWRLIEIRSPRPGHSLYDRRADPGERKDLAADRSVRTGYLGGRLRAEERPRKGALQAGEGTIDEETRKQLQALGYMH